MKKDTDILQTMTITLRSKILGPNPKFQQIFYFKKQQPSQLDIFLPAEEQMSFTFFLLKRR